MTPYTTLADNPHLLEALREAIKRQFEDERTDSAVSDSELGQLYRARMLAKEKIDAAFREINLHRTRVESKERVVNPGR